MFDLELKWNREAKLSSEKWTTRVLRVRISPQPGENGGPELPEVVLRLIPSKLPRTPEVINLKKFCRSYPSRSYPEYLPLEKTDRNELMIGTVQKNAQTDVLIELDIPKIVPPIDDDGPPGLVEVIKVEIRVGKEESTKRAKINFTNVETHVNRTNDDVESDWRKWKNFEQQSIDNKYNVLETFLKTKKWEKADAETVKLILKEAKREKKGYLNLNSIKDFPCDVLRTIDDLWVKYSDGKFGFSVQNRIWKAVGGDRNPNSQTYDKFGDRVGWRSAIFWYGDLTFDISAPEGHLPSGRSGNIALKKKIVGWFGGFGLERIRALTSKLDECDIK